MNQYNEPVFIKVFKYKVMFYLVSNAEIFFSYSSCNRATDISAAILILRKLNINQIVHALLQREKLFTSFVIQTEIVKIKDIQLRNIIELDSA